MFSFFKSKKHSPSSTPPNEQAIPSSDDFIFVDKKDEPKPYPENLHPSFGGGSYFPPPVVIKPAKPVNYLHQVPFKLSTELTIGEGNNTEVTQFLIDEIVTRVERINFNVVEYDFTLEREIVSQG